MFHVSETQFYVRDGVLICSRVRAEDPSVSCVDLKGVTLLYRQAESVWELGYSSGRGDFVRIAEFETKSEARKALTAAQRKIKMSGFGRRVLGVMLGLILLFVLFSIGSVMSFAYSQTAAMMSSAQGMPSSVPEGQPMSADQLLSAPN